MDVFDIQPIDNDSQLQYMMNDSVLSFIMPDVYRLFLNITIQHVRNLFNNVLSCSFLEFEHDIDSIFDEINAYIPQFTTRSDTPSRHEKRWIFGDAFTVISGLVTAYRINDSYTFRRNVQCTLHYILSKHNHFHQDILTNKRYLLALAENSAINFKDVISDIAKLKSDTDGKFYHYLHHLMHTTANSIFYKNFVLHYVNILNHLDHDLVSHNRIERIKTSLYMKCRNFISGLHILARNQIPESILHAGVFSNILDRVAKYLS